MNIRELRCITTLDIEPCKVLHAALNARLDKVVIIGITVDGEAYHAGSTGNIGDILLMLEKFKIVLLKHEESGG